MEAAKEAVAAKTAEIRTNDDGPRSESSKDNSIPWKIKILAVVLVSLIGFGSHWSSGVTGAMKSTIKKVRFTRLTKG